MLGSDVASDSAVSKQHLKFFLDMKYFNQLVDLVDPLQGPRRTWQPVTGKEIPKGRGSASLEESRYSLGGASVS